eukprot:CAMPEP_0113573936 /NCGR_PEP_ID=MMETSP0015_2-20120614/26882_1 /TAXON_ID=2838 /ORGANISM="Odontella" /LENGTH=363 /DNA_ID=CAMNT_0000477045 /DNA_START=105 /DNA_END=1196 /DNA_ORIENTATION=- /assembly_acc=CAM_ASM_000160
MSSAESESKPEQSDPEVSTLPAASPGQKRPRNAADAASSCGNDESETSEAATKKDASDRPEKPSPGATPITIEGEMPQKKFYRSRAHCNPLSHNDAFDYPLGPDDVDWTAEHYPNHPALLPSEGENGGVEATADEDRRKKSVAPDVLDIGCGFGGLTVALSTLLPERTILGMEIRAKVTEYVRLRTVALRRDHPGKYQNASVLRTNSMRYLPNYFRKGRLEKIFFCFPDPHFKRRNYPRRIVSERLLTEYAHLLRPGGRLYTITDVKELHQWHLDKCRSHPLFRELTEEEMAKDPCVEAMRVETEEGKKVEREGRTPDVGYAVWERLDEKDERVPRVTAENFWEEGQFGVTVSQGKEEKKEGK